MTLKSFVPALLSVFLLSGCALHKPKAAAPLPLPENFAAALGDTGDATLPERWWTLFDDPRLDALMEQAFAGNLDLAQALARLEQLQAMGRQSAAARQPYLNLEGSGGRGRQQSIAGPVSSDSFRLSAAAGFELDLWQKLKSRSDAADLDVLASRQDIQSLYLSLTAQLAELYYLAVEQRAQLALTDSTIVSFEDSLARVEDRYRSGLVPAVDVYQARQNLAAAKARRPQVERTLATTEHALAVLLGRYPGPTLSGDSATLPALEKAFAIGLPSQLLTRRPDISAALARLQASDERIGAAIAERFPSFALIGNTGGASGELDTLLSSPNIFWNLLLNLAQPVIDGGRRKAEVERTQAVFRESLAEYHLVVLRAFQEVEDALAQGRTSAERIGLLEARLAAASAARRLALDRYLQGLSDYLPVLTSQATEFDAESQLLAARRQLVSDRIALARGLGGGWMEQALESRLNTTSEQGSEL
ncbi:efflux transporter outer membrane subunit [Trichloromonas sp.]|uniref:efflux transporter outer membrane subunit n=1 Tax=Trichloromonas sp. TaxID=3069249 RepID=UPI003D8191B6